MPEFDGEVNFSRSAADDCALAIPRSISPIGILLCREKNLVIADMLSVIWRSQIAVSSYHYGHSLPPQFQEQLPDTARLKDVILPSAIDSGGVSPRWLWAKPR